MHTKFWFENLEGTDHLQDLHIDGKIISEWILGKNYRKRSGFIWPRTRDQ